MISSNPVRCVNLDWLEVHAFEIGNPKDAEYFRSLGFRVVERDYGTRVYKEMFTLYDSHDQPFVEVRRNPFSQGYQGIHAAEECHLRLVNAACYYESAAGMLATFMADYGYQFNRIARVDICMDFEYFDYGDKPSDFVRRYFKHKYAKINQGNITAHGADRWDGQDWNSISWGAPSSDIGTKFYNKTMELYDPKTNSFAKPHIRYAWLKCGLIDDFHSCKKTAKDGTIYVPQIWRLEFSIRSSVKKWFAIELNGQQRKRGNNKNMQSVRNTLDMYDSREKLITLFASLANHYFHFKYVIKRYDFYKTGNTEGKAIRKDRCPDKLLFNFKGEQLTYKIDKTDNAPTIMGDSKGQFKPLDSLLRQIRLFQQSHNAQEVHDACNVLIRFIEGDKLRSDLTRPWSFHDLMLLQRVIAERSSGNQTQVKILLNEIRELLKINDRTAIF